MDLWNKIKYHKEHCNKKMVRINENVFIGNSNIQLKNIDGIPIYENILNDQVQDFNVVYDFSKNGKIYDIYIEGSVQTPADYSILPNGNNQTYRIDKNGFSDGTYYTESSLNIIKFRVDNSFCIHYTMQLLSNNRISFIGDWANRTLNYNSSYNRHITAI